MSSDLVPMTQQMLSLRSMEDLEHFAKTISQSIFVPQPFRGKPGDVIAAVLYGMERGLSPMASLQNVAVINGKPSVYGDMLLAICLSDPSTESIEEAETAEIEETHIAWCTAKRKGRKLVRRTFSQKDAERAKLWNKDGPWRDFPTRMLMMRARSWCLRDAYADRLMGLQAREEAQDIIDITPEPAPSPSSSVEPAPAPAPADKPAPATARQAKPDVPALLKAISQELTRLCGDSQQDKVDMARDTFGSAVTSAKILEQLPTKSLERGLAKLQAKPTPTVPEPSEDDVPLYGAQEASELTIEAPEPVEASDVPEHTMGVDPDAPLETPAAEPRMQGSVVDPGAVGVLMVWAGMAGQQAILDKFCADKRMENGLPVLPKITYQLIRTEVLKATGQLATKGGDRC